MFAGGRAEPSQIRAVSLLFFVAAAALATTSGQGAPSPGHANRPDTDEPSAPRPPFVVTTEVVLESAIDFTAAASGTTHHLSISALPWAGARLELTADGAFGTAADRATASAEGILDTDAAAAGSDCRPAAANATIPAG